MSDSHKKVSDLLICSFLVSYSLMVTHSLWTNWANRSEGMIESFAFKKNCKTFKNTFFSNLFWVNRSFFVSERENEQFSKKKHSDSLICSFVLSDPSESLTFTHLSWATWATHSQSLWATWANCSQSLICLEWWANELLRNPEILQF